jgi:hypothetical protein
MEYIWVQDQSTFIKDFEKWFFTPIAIAIPLTGDTNY